MAKFIRVHSDGSETLLNLDHIAGTMVDENGDTCIMLAYKLQIVTCDESMQELTEMIGSACGGIPMGSSKRKLAASEEA